MKELTKIIGLLSLVLMVSCGSGSPSKENLESCINGNQEMCQELGDDTPPTETPVVEVEKIFENMTSIEFKGYTLPFFRIGEENGVEFRQFRLEIKEKNLNDYTLLQITLFEDNAGFVRFEYNTINALAYGQTWSLTEDGTFSFGDIVLTATFANQE